MSEKVLLNKSLSGGGLQVIRPAFAALCGFGVATGTVSLARADCVKNVASNDVLWVRVQPNPQARQRGSIPSDGCGVNVGRCLRSGWCEVSYHGVTGWVNGGYLSKTTAAPAPSGGGGNTSVTQQQQNQTITNKSQTIIIAPSQ